MQDGAIRICSAPENPILELRVPPTKKQMDVLYDWADYVKDSRDQILVSFDFSEYESIDPENAFRIPGIVRRKFGSTLEESEKEQVDWESIKKFFGTTDDFEDSLWIVPDGSLLGKNFDRHAARHEDIDKYDGPGRRFRNGDEFLRSGAIRIEPVPGGYLTIEIYVPPTKSQMERLYDLVDYARKNPFEKIELSTGPEDLEFVDLDNSKRVIWLIRRKFGSTLLEKYKGDRSECSTME